MNILLVEPDYRLAQTYSAFLQPQHKVVHCSTAQDAISAADLQKPDLVIVEPQLTNHSGIEFLYEFRSYDDWRFVPVILVTTIPEAALAPSSGLLKQRLGVRSYHYKPTLTLQELGQAVLL